MLYGEEKAREMRRSILPARASSRRAARFDLRAASRHGRRSVRQAIRGWRRPDEEEGGLDDAALLGAVRGLERQARIDTRQAVGYRRGADKLGPFLRWAAAITADIPESEPQRRYERVASRLGGARDVIRRHALGHFIDPERDFNLAARGRMGWAEARRQHQAAREATATRLGDWLAGQLEEDHGRVNRWLKALGRAAPRDALCPAGAPCVAMRWGWRIQHDEARCVQAGRFAVGGAVELRERIASLTPMPAYGTFDGLKELLLIVGWEEEAAAAGR